uniref:Trypsinogen-like protein 3 n=1 Tax=Takifugu rubripes TaxID=31033 RepID=A0A674N146_TAKRU
MNLLLLLVALSFSEAVPLQGAAECQPQSRPWHVRLGRSCSGALVDPRWIVTSFACAPLSSNITASLGDHDVSVAEGTEQHIDTDLTVLHSPYRSPFHSLAMVRLAKPARFNQYVQPIPLPSRCPQPGETCRVSGWGSTVPNQDESPKRLKCISVPVVDDRTCRELFPMHWSHGMVCAGQVDGTNCLVRVDTRSDLCTSAVSLSNVWSVAGPGRPRRCDGVWRAAAGRPVVQLWVLQPSGPQHLQQNMPVHQVDEGRNAEQLTHLGPDHPPPTHPPLHSATDHPPVLSERGCRGRPACAGCSLKSTVSASAS